jgi:hypothetical protein
VDDGLGLAEDLEQHRGHLVGLARDQEESPDFRFFLG